MQQNVIPDIQNIIISYCNLIFVKLIYGINNNEYELRVFDTNLTFRTIAKLIEIERRLNGSNKSIYSKHVRIWMRYSIYKRIYPISTKNIVVLKWELDANTEPSKWMEVPDDYTILYLADIDKPLNYNEILEIGVDVYDKFEKKWSFKTNDKLNLSRDEWLKSLKTGDIINVKDSQNKWYESLVRYVDGNKVYIHFIGWNVQWDTCYDCNIEDDVECLDRRYSHRRRAHKPTGPHDVKLILVCSVGQSNNFISLVSFQSSLSN